MHSLYVPVATLIETVAADVVMPRYRNLSAEEISEKAANDFVTIADRESEIRLEAGLRALMPDAGVIGEEACAADSSVLDNSGTGVHWVIDPIDGTRNFAIGEPPFGIMVALIEDGAAKAGWIYDPLRHRMCHAVKGGGAYIDRERISAQATGSRPPRAALASYFLPQEQREDLQRRAEGRFIEVEVPFCAAEQYPRLVLAHTDIAFFWRALIWDHAPGALFVNEAGGRVARLDGSDYVAGNDRLGLLGAASPQLWDEAARILFA